MADLNALIEKNKALWTRVYDEVIAPDIEDEWKKSEYSLVRNVQRLTTRQRSKFTRKNWTRVCTLINLPHVVAAD